MIQLIHGNLDSIRQLCRSHKVSSFYLFGSAAKGNSNNNSDIDFLVRFSNSVDTMEYADNYFDLLENLQKLLNRSIDLVSEKSLTNRYLIEDINQSKLLIYEA